MLSVYPYASGSFYTSSYAISSSYANSAQYIAYVNTASNAATVLNPRSGSRGKSICLISTDMYVLLQTNLSLIENCNFD